MSALPTYVKDPDETRRFGVDWSAPLAVNSATISSVAWSAAPSGLTLSGESNDSTTASTLVAGGTLGSAYTLTCRATMSDGQILDFTLGILIASL